MALTKLTGLQINDAVVIDDVAFVVNDENTDTINVELQLQAGGEDLDQVGVVQAYLSDAATGIGVTATAPDGDIAIGTDGAILGEMVADKVFLLQSEADGDIDLDIGEAAGGTWYLCVILPGGTIKVSGAITFAA
jgi:hypothetical protein